LSRTTPTIGTSAYKRVLADSKVLWAVAGTLKTPAMADRRPARSLAAVHTQMITGEQLSKFPDEKGVPDHFNANMVLCVQYFVYY
jgi:hypothetical protein